MNVKTITAPNIHAALIEARRTLGDDVVLMESIPAEDGRPARITVMADGAARGRADGRRRQAIEPRLPAGAYGLQEPGQSLHGDPHSGTASSDMQAEDHARSGVRPARPAARAAKAGLDSAGYGYGPPETSTVHESEDPARIAEALSFGGGDSSETGGGASREAVEGASSRLGEAVLSGHDAEHISAYDFSVGGRTLRDVPPVGRPAPAATTRESPSSDLAAAIAGRGSLYPSRHEFSDDRTLPVPSGALEALQQLMTSQMRLLHDRLDAIEQRFGTAVVGTAHAWIANPIYTDLLHQGLRPASVTKLFDALAQKGYRPDSDRETLKWAAAQEFRRSLDVSAPPQTSGAQVFIGPSGAGKTSLLLKLARHPGFYGRRSATVILIDCDESLTGFHFNPIELFRSYGLPVQLVRTVEEMHRAILRVQQFEHILIDTPPLPLHPARARKMIGHIKKLVDPIMPLRVQFVLNATRAIEDFDRRYVQGLALRPDAVSFTHLDETAGWGRIAEWLLAVEMPMQFVSTGPGVPDDVSAFSPTWFVEEMMKL